MNDTLSNTQQSRETIECDVLIVGAGPPDYLQLLNLNYRQMMQEKNCPLSSLIKELSTVLIFSVGQSWIPER